MRQTLVMRTRPPHTLLTPPIPSFKANRLWDVPGSCTNCEAHAQRALIGAGSAL